MTDIHFYSYKHGKWVKKKQLKNPLLSSLYDTVKVLDEKYKIKHWAIPANYHPSDFPEILKMETIMKKHVQFYNNDFYLHDMHSYLEGDRTAIWLLRNTGTHYIPLDEHFSKESIDLYKQYLRCNSFFYLIKGGVIKKITKDKALKMILEKGELQQAA